MSKKLKERNQEQELKNTFRIYDQDDTGFIEFDDMRRVATELTEGKKKDQEIKDDIIWGMLYEATGEPEREKMKVNEAQFMRIMKKGKLY